MWLELPFQHSTAIIHIHTDYFQQLSLIRVRLVVVCDGQESKASFARSKKSQSPEATHFFSDSLEILSLSLSLSLSLALSSRISPSPSPTYSHFSKTNPSTFPFSQTLPFEIFSILRNYAKRSGLESPHCKLQFWWVLVTLSREALELGQVTNRTASPPRHPFLSLRTSLAPRFSSVWTRWKRRE